MLDRERAKERFKEDTENHKMEVLMDNGIYRHLKFTNNGSQCYRFDIHTWAGYLCVDGDMGCYVFRRIPDMFEFFRMDDNDFNKKNIINPGYWSEKLEAVNSDSARSNDGNGYEEFSQEAFKDAVKQEYDNFCEEYEVTIEEERDEIQDELLRDETDNIEDVIAENESAESEPELTKTEQQLEDLWNEIEQDVIGASYDGHIRGYDAAMDFRWESDAGDMKFDMSDFWDHDCTEYTFHFIWILYAIVYGIGEYDKLQVKNANTSVASD